MFQLALRGVRHNVGRYLATLVAIITGVAFFTATGFISERVIDSLQGDVDTQYGAVDVAVVVDDADVSDFAEELRVPAATVEAIESLDGVQAVGGELTGPVAFGAQDGGTFGEATGRLWVTDDELNPIDVVEGEAPDIVGEIAVDAGLADREDLSVGDEVVLLTVGGEFPTEVVGITRFGGNDALDQGGTVSLPEAAAFEWLNSGLEEYTSVYVRGDGDGLDQQVAELLPEGYVAQSGDEFRADQREEAGSFGRFLETGLRVFALIALFVGGFVIYNTFSVIVAQRQRELAVLAAVGATPRQLKRSLRFEGLLIGVLGSALGVAVGIALAFVLVAVLDAIGVSLPGSGIVVGPSNVISGIFLGTIITYVSVMVPARRASRVEPIEALRDAAVETRALSRPRGIAAAVLVGAGVAALFVGASPVLIGFGVLFLVVGVLVGGPFLAVGGARALRPVFRPLGLEGQLAVDNSARNPKRTATTANALLIGVFLVTLVTVAGTSLKDFVVDEIQDLEGADFVVSSEGGSIDPDLVGALEGIDDVEEVIPFRRESAIVAGQPGQLSTADAGALVEVAGISVTAGSLDDLVPGTIAVADPTGFASVEGGEEVALGSTVTVASAQGASAELEVVAFLEATIDEVQVGSLVAVETFDELVGDTAPTVAFVDVVSGTQSDVQDAIDEVVARRPDISVTAGNSLAQLLAGVFDFMINAVNGLLAMSVIIALIGIVNTLSLSILERRRELGLLRVVGMTDSRVHRMVRLESALVAALGTVTGVVLGLVIGWGLVGAIDRSSDAGIGFSLPTVPLLVVLVLGIGLGFLASVIPARRSTRLEVLDAISAT